MTPAQRRGIFLVGAAGLVAFFLWGLLGLPGFGRYPGPYGFVINRIALGHEVVFLEYIPHLREHFVHPAVVRDGVYQTPQEPGSSSDLKAVQP